MRSCTFAVTHFLVACLLSIASAEAQWGTIKGQVTVTGTVSELPVLVKSGEPATKDSSICAAADIPNESIIINPRSKGLANVVFWLSQKPTSIHPDLIKSKEPEVVLRQTGCRYAPHVTIMRTDQKLRLLNSDAVAHNQHIYAMKNVQFSAVVAPSSREGELVSYLTKPESLPIKIGCDIHPWMQGWIVVQDHPYVATTNSDGEFEIVNLPTGEHEFRIWHEQAGYLEKAYKVSVKQGNNVLSPTKVPATAFK